MLPHDAGQSAECTRTRNTQESLLALGIKGSPICVDLLANFLSVSSSRFAIAGALGCAVTHGALTPVDVVKTRIQLEPEVYNRVRTSPAASRD